MNYNVRLIVLTCLLESHCEDHVSNNYGIEPIVLNDKDDV